MLTNVPLKESEKKMVIHGSVINISLLQQGTPTTTPAPTTKG